MTRIVRKSWQVAHKAAHGRPLDGGHVTGTNELLNRRKSTHIVYDMTGQQYNISDNVVRFYGGLQRGWIIDMYSGELVVLLVTVYVPGLEIIYCTGL